MSTSEEHNLKKAACHAEEARTRLQTLQLDERILLSETQTDRVEAFANHLASIKKGIDDIRENVAERRSQVTV